MTSRVSIMDSRSSLLLALLLSALCVLANSLSLPSNDMKESALQMDLDDKETDQGRRATWLETRDLEDDFKELVLLTIQELENEGRLVPGIVAPQQPAKEKRGRWQGFCFKRTRSGRFLPYICWKGDRK
nr:whitnin-2 [Urechis unicinctus]